MFIIDTDHINKDEKDVPSRAGWKSRNFVEGTPLPFKWRTMDGDGEIYYEGRSSEEDFKPLDFATADAGCVSIEYHNPTTGRWEEL